MFTRAKTQQGESIAKFLSIKTCQIKMNRRNPSKNSSNTRTPKPKNRAPLLTNLGGESKGKEPRRVHTYIPHQIPNRKVQKTLQKSHQERALKITKKSEREEHNQALRNHAESSIHHKKFHTRSSLPADHPTQSQDLIMKLSS
jgi:hypothetical protein